MRGDRLDEGLAFSATKRGKKEKPSIPTYLYQYPLLANLMPADEFNARNVREIGPAPLPLERAVEVSRKPAYTHIAKRAGGGGWGHVTETNPATVQRKAKIKELREGVKREC